MEYNTIPVPNTGPLGGINIALDLEARLRPEVPVALECLVTEDPGVIQNARQLTAGFYLKRSFISPDQLDEAGTIKAKFDPHKDNADYYVLKEHDSNTVTATLRKIHYDSTMDRKSFPLLEHETELYPESAAELERIGIPNLFEVSALVKDPDRDSDGMAALTLYKKLFVDAWTTNVNEKATFIMACNPKLYEMFKVLFDGSMERIGPDLHYPGQDAVPVMFRLKEGAINLVQKTTDRKNRFAEVHKIVVDYFLDGVDAAALDPDLVAALYQAGRFSTLAKMPSSGIERDDPRIETRAKTIADLRKEAIKATLREKISHRKPEMVAAVGLLGYTAVRTLIVGNTMGLESHVDWRVFLGIEVGTTPQYVWGMGELARAALKPEQYSVKRRVGAVALAGSALIAPYAYVAAEGGAAHAEGAIGFGALLGLAAASGVMSKIKNRRNNRKQEVVVPQDDSRLAEDRPQP